ncbi:hypothetical protein Tco_0596140 [Tanacetum coccineum]
MALIPIVKNRSRPDWQFDIDALTRTMNYEPIAAGTQYNDFSATKASDNACQASPNGFSDDGSNLQVMMERRLMKIQEKKVKVMIKRKKIMLKALTMLMLLAQMSIFEDVGAEADMNNLDTTIQVSPILTTRIHKDHSLS